MGPKSALPLLQLILALLAPGRSLPLSSPPAAPSPQPPPSLPPPSPPLSSPPLSLLASSSSSSSSSSSWSSVPSTLILHDDGGLLLSQTGSRHDGFLSSSSSSSSPSPSRSGGTQLSYQDGNPGILEAVLPPSPWEGGGVPGRRQGGPVRPPVPPATRRRRWRRSEDGSGGRARQASQSRDQAVAHGTSREKFLQVLHLLLLRSRGSAAALAASVPQLEAAAASSPRSPAQLSRGGHRLPRPSPAVRVRAEEGDSGVDILPQDFSPQRAAGSAARVELQEPAVAACCPGDRGSSRPAPGQAAKTTALERPKSGQLVRDAVIARVSKKQHNATPSIQDQATAHVAAPARDHKSAGANIGGAGMSKSTRGVGRFTPDSLATTVKDSEPPELGRHKTASKDLPHLRAKSLTNFRFTASRALTPLFSPPHGSAASRGVLDDQRSAGGGLEGLEGATLRAVNASRGSIVRDEGVLGSERRRRSPYFMDNRIRPWVTAEVKLDLSYSHVGHCAHADRHYCLNGGTCVFVGALDIKTCRCPVGYTGLRCEEMDQAFLIALLTNSIYSFE